MKYISFFCLVSIIILLCYFLMVLIFFQVIYEALNGHRVSWKKALHLLNERFVEGKIAREEADRPCILLIDELDLLVTRNQSVIYKSSIRKLVIKSTFFKTCNHIVIFFLFSQVLYNILDWPTKPHSKLIVIGKIILFSISFSVL